MLFRSWDDTEKQYYIEIGYERMFIEVEDTAYFVIGLTHDQAAVGAGYTRILAQVSNFSEVQIAPPANGLSPLKYINGTLYLELSVANQRAKFLSAPFYDLMKSLEEDETHYFITIEGKRVNLSPKDSENLVGIQDDRLSGLKRH